MRGREGKGKEKGRGGKEKERKGRQKTIRRVKRQATEWENVFTIDTTNKGLYIFVPKYIKRFQNIHVQCLKK